MSLCLARNEIKDFLCKRYNYTTRKCEKTVCSLRRIVGLQRKTDLNDTKAEQNKTDSTDKSENKVRQIVDNGQRRSFVPAANAVTDRHIKQRYGRAEICMSVIFNSGRYDYEVLAFVRKKRR